MKEHVTITEDARKFRLRQKMNEDIKRIAEHYTFENQSKQLIEECAELIQAINKYQRYAEGYNAESKEYDWKYYQNVIEEIADVEIMLDQTKILLHFSNEAVEEIKQKKVNRQLERMEQEAGD